MRGGRIDTSAHCCISVAEVTWKNQTKQLNRRTQSKTNAHDNNVSQVQQEQEDRLVQLDLLVPDEAHHDQQRERVVYRVPRERVPIEVEHLTYHTYSHSTCFEVSIKWATRETMWVGEWVCGCKILVQCHSVLASV